MGRYIKQFGIILGVTCVGEVMKYFLPFPFPGSIYGLVLMLILLKTGIIKIESVKETGDFLLEAMPMMFIPAAVGLISSWDQLKSRLFPFAVITIITTFLVMIVTGKVTGILLRKLKPPKQ